MSEKILDTGYKKMELPECKELYERIQLSAEKKRTIQAQIQEKTTSRKRVHVGYATVAACFCLFLFSGMTIMAANGGFAQTFLKLQQWMKGENISLSEKQLEEYEIHGQEIDLTIPYSGGTLTFEDAFYDSHFIYVTYDFKDIKNSNILENTTILINGNEYGYSSYSIALTESTHYLLWVTEEPIVQDTTVEIWDANGEENLGSFILTQSNELLAKDCLEEPVLLTDEAEITSVQISPLSVSVEGDGHIVGKPDITVWKKDGTKVAYSVTGFSGFLDADEEGETFSCHFPFEAPCPLDEIEKITIVISGKEIVVKI